MKETTVECAENVIVLLKTHFSRVPVERVGAGVAKGFDPDSLLELAFQYQQAAEEVVKELDL